jgi:hypothetical protein
MKRYSVVVVSLLCLAGCHVQLVTNAVQGSGIKASETRETGEFTGIELNGSMDVSVTVGDKTTVTVEGDDNLLELVVTEVSNGTLTISNQGSYSTQIGIKLVVTTPKLDSASVTGSGDIQIKELKASDFEALISGSGSITAAGAADRLELSITGSGDVHLGALPAKEVSAEISGSGSAQVQVTESLSVAITGSGSVTYSGNPRSVEKSIQGSGSVQAK